MADAHTIQWRWRVLLQVPDELVTSYVEYCLEEDYEWRVNFIEAQILSYRIHRLKTEREYPLDFDLEKFNRWLKEQDPNG